MSNPFLGEIRMFAGNFPPAQWALCNGQLMAISQNTALFSLLGTNYGGDGRSTFGLPNLQGMTPVNAGQGPGLSQYVIGQTGGSQAVTLLSTQMPSHTHTVKASGLAGNQSTINNNAIAKLPLNEFQFAAATSTTDSYGSATTSAGGGLPHNNMQPYLCVTFIIALQGIYPQRP